MTKLSEEKISENFRKMYEKMAHDTVEYGQSLIGIPDGDNSFMYTIGNAARNMPDLLITGAFCMAPSMSRLINLLGDIQAERGEAFKHGEMIDIGAMFNVLALDGSNQHVRDTYTIQAGQFYNREDYEVRVLIFCDRDGNYPPSPDCAYPFNGQYLPPEALLLGQ